MCNVSHLAQDESGLSLAHFRSIGAIMQPWQLQNFYSFWILLDILDLLVQLVLGRSGERAWQEVERLNNARAFLFLQQLAAISAQVLAGTRYPLSSRWKN